ncbi:uncharacterized protein LOC109836382 [Asparagus officinalis]|uniref:uncharacterized protein LOC109836382 n=1 Tax=Asparagus officinalis TaxID=4686 RepID=UPI00098E86A7|nr:uncharacterized protein LOC109836382 [Asparagus officinalis]XP_020259855.1 uncharacterized protein LOC109836382 [Asparagus officinalis]XP_020259858.1 uncharacterized protein LOC109836382 [Asparagus officinalis]XP_020259859.1 uncharacterized protein LOC109836382 [Asparagus officinalis]XP_020259860.1 uncharacterized protein LOC109836382 [Asparagus officinalis]
MMKKKERRKKESTFSPTTKHPRPSLLTGGLVETVPPIVCTKRESMKEKDFKLMKRKDLQALCKKEGIPANTSNSKMAEALYLARWRPWGDLPREILDLFLEELSFGDHVRFGAVCKSWRSASRDKPHRLAIKWPWLVFPQLPLEDSLSIYSPMEAYIHQLNIIMSPGFECLGHSMGWLIIYHIAEGYYILNPLNNQTLELPSLHRDFFSSDQEISDSASEFSNDHHFPMLEYRNLHNDSGTDSDTDSDNEINNGSEINDYKLFRRGIVFDIPYSLGVAAQSEYGGLYMCRPGDDEWLILIENFYGAFICYRGSLYCVGLGTWRNVVMCYYFDIEPKLLWRKTIELPEICTNNASQTYLVESNLGGLLLILRKVDEVDDGKANLVTTGFHVFRLDHSANKWIRIQTLHDEVIFVSSFGESCARTTTIGNSSGYKANHIYFTDMKSGTLLHDDDSDRHYDQGIFSLADGGITEWSLIGSYSPLNVPFWFFPKV